MMLRGISIEQWNAIGTIAAAVAALVVAAFGAIQLRHQAEDRKSRQAAAGARISATGYLLRQQLLRWGAWAPSKERDFDDWIIDVTNRRIVHKFSTQPIEFAREMMTLIGEAPPDTANKVRRIYVYLLAGIERMKAIDPQHGNITALGTALRDCGADFRECLQLLENGVIEPILLTEAGVRERLRQEGSNAGHTAIQEDAFDGPDEESPRNV